MRTYTKREMAHILQVSPRTIADDAKFLNLKPTQSDRGMNLYSNQDFNLIQQLRTHCGFILTREVNVGAKYLWKVSSNRDWLSKNKK